MASPTLLACKDTHSTSVCSLTGCLFVWSLLLIGCEGTNGTAADVEQSPEEIAEPVCADPVTESVDHDSLEEQIGFELIQTIDEGNERAWISPSINYADFQAIELTDGWLKNQPRESPECGADEVRFLKSPDGTAPGDILIEEHFGFQWFHAATITQRDVPLDDEGLLMGVMVKKYHELVYKAGSCMVLLSSPEGEVYFRIGRDATRTCNTPTLPTGWQLMDYAPAEDLTIELFEENLVIRTDNQDSFQGPVPQLRDVLKEQK